MLRRKARKTSQRQRKRKASSPPRHTVVYGVYGPEERVGRDRDEQSA